MRTTASVFGILTVSVALLVASGTTAKGDSLIYTFGPVNCDMGANSDFTTSMSVPQFNPSLGVLDSIDLVLNSSYSSGVAVSGPEGASGNFNLYETTTFQDAGNNINLTIGNEWTCYFSLPAYTSNGSSSPGEMRPSFCDTAVLGEFTGAGNFSFQVTASQHASTALLPPGIAAQITDGEFLAGGSVTYNYTVPEPGAASLLVIGFGLMLARSKAKRFRP